MTTEEQRIAIAEACGWKRDGQRFTHPDTKGAAFFPPVFCEKKLPDYLNDLNAIQSAVLSQGSSFQDTFQSALNCVAFDHGKLFCQLTAEDWSRAFLVSKGLWK